MPVTNPYPEIKAAEVEEFDRLNTYLRNLDGAGWEEQSYCADWLVYQAVSHLGSGSRIGKLRLDAWINGAAPLSRETMLEVWGRFDSLGPSEMLSEYLKAVGEYLVAERSIPDEAGLQDVDGFRGKQPLYLYQLFRVWEMTCHSWDVLVARDRTARFNAKAVELLADKLDAVGPTIDRDRAATLAEAGVQLNLAGTAISYVLDLSGERPRLQKGPHKDPALVVEAPAEEICRLISGRHFVPGSRPELKALKGSSEDLAKLKRAFR